MFDDVVDRKEGFLEHKNVTLPWSKFLLSFFFLQKRLDSLVDGILSRKEGFVAYKNVILTQLNNLHFRKRFVAYKNAILA